MQKKIIPHVEQGYIVLCDRYHDSTWAYQGYGRGRMEELKSFGNYVYGNYLPNITLFFDIPFEESARRIQARLGSADRFDQAEEEFRRRVYEGYQQQLGCGYDRVYESERVIHRIDALPDPDSVAERVRAWVNANFENLS